MRTPVQIQHDAFSRSVLYRRVYPYQNMTCRWCSTNKKTTFEYWWQADDKLAPPFEQLPARTGPFCNVDCYKAYNS